MVQNRGHAGKVYFCDNLGIATLVSWSPPCSSAAHVWDPLHHPVPAAIPAPCVGPIVAASSETEAVKGDRTKAGSWWQPAKATYPSSPPFLSEGAGSIAPLPTLPSSPRSRAPNRSFILLRVQGKGKVLLREEALEPRHSCRGPRRWLFHVD